MTTLTGDAVEQAALDWLSALGRQAILRYRFDEED